MYTYFNGEFSSVYKGYCHLVLLHVGFNYRWSKLRPCFIHPWNCLGLILMNGSPLFIRPRYKVVGFAVYLDAIARIVILTPSYLSETSRILNRSRGAKIFRVKFRIGWAFWNCFRQDTNIQICHMGKIGG